MQQNTTVNKSFKLLAIVTILTYLYLISRTVHLRGADDDQVFLSIFNSGNIIDLLVNRFNTWSGRFTLELLMTTTIGYSTFWKIGIPLSVAVVCYCCSKIAGFKSLVLPFTLAIFLFASIPNQINVDSSWWVTGFYNYLLPVAAALYAFKVCFLGGSTKLEKLICILLTFYFPYMEQAGLAFIVAMGCLIFSERKSISRFNVIIVIIAAINLFICLKAPGNENRFALEAWRWYPQYQTYGIANKLSLGFDKLHQLMTFTFNIPLIALMVSIFYVRCSYSDMNKSVKISLFFIATFIAISIANSFTDFFSRGFFFNSATIDATRWSAARLYISYLYLFIVISSMFIILIDCFLSKGSGLAPIVAMLIGFMTVTMLGLSPTVYASGYRVDFVFEIMCIISCMSLIKPLAK